MPCRDYVTEQDHTVDLRDRLDKATRLLCEILREHRDSLNLSDEASEWWRQHEAADARRVAEDRRQLCAKIMQNESMIREYEVANIAMRERLEKLGK